MATMPAASPSSPSIRLMALVMPSTHSTLSRYDQLGSRMNVDTNGMRRVRMLMPDSTSTLADTTMPDDLGRGRHLPEVVDDPHGQDHARRR